MLFVPLGRGRHAGSCSSQQCGRSRWSSGDTQNYCRNRAAVNGAGVYAQKEGKSLYGSNVKGERQSNGDPQWGSKPGYNSNHDAQPHSHEEEKYIERLYKLS